MTRLQQFVVGALVVMLAFGGLGVYLLEQVSDRLIETPMVAGIHGIETSWRSDRGAHRVWTIIPRGSDYKPWLAEHVAAFTEAQRQLPPR